MKPFEYVTPTHKFCSCKKAIDIFFCTGRCVDSRADYKNITVEEKELDDKESNDIIKEKL